MRAEKKRPEISILTDPMLFEREFMSEGIRRIVRETKDRLAPKKRNFNGFSYRGHAAVTRSLIDGLRKINASFNYNPNYLSQLADRIIVLSGARTLKQLIRLKRKGKIRKLFAGPNIVVFPSDFDSLIAAPEIDYVITPSDWVMNLYGEEKPFLRERCFSWPAGVDTEFWRPKSEVARENILIYYKPSIGMSESIQPYIEYLRGIGWRVNVIQYGLYVYSKYLEELEKSCLMVGFSAGESQGIGLAEAWSVDVPTLLWENTSNICNGRSFNSSTAPYLNKKNGLFFKNIEEFKVQFLFWSNHSNEFSARDWVLKNMSDEICASILYKKAIEC